MSDKNMTIMSVDGFSMMRRIIRSLLSQIGYSNVLDAEDGKAALKALEEQDIDFVISDWNTPGLSGLELLKAIRSNQRLKRTRFLIITPEAKRENIVRAKKAGVDNYIVKPFTAEVLKHKIDQIFTE